MTVSASKAMMLQKVRSVVSRLRLSRAVLALSGAVALAMVVTGCSGAAGDDGPVGTSEDQALSVCAVGDTVEGVDVSYYNGTIDWAALKASGRAFVFARVSDGDGYLDPKFQGYWAAMREYGFVRGVYQFYRAAESGVDQANVLLANVGALGDGDLPPVLDVEVTDGASDAELVAGVKDWVDTVRAATGKQPIVYTAPGFWNAVSGSAALSPASTLWVANWDVSCPLVPIGWKAWQFWQYSDTGRPPGISGAVDLDRFNGTLAELQALATSPHPVNEHPPSVPNSGETAVSAPAPVAAAGAAWGEGDAR